MNATETKVSMIRHRLYEVLSRYERVNGNPAVGPVVGFRSICELAATLAHLAEDAKVSMERSKLFLKNNGVHPDTLDATVFRANVDSLEWLNKLHRKTNDAMENEEEPTNPNLRITDA